MAEKIYILDGVGLPKWNSPISHAVVVNNMCYVSGQLSIDLNGEYLKGSIEKETNLAFANFFAALNNSGFNREDVVFIDIAFDNLKDLPRVNKIFMSLFPKAKRPARTIYQAEKLPYGGKIKITGTAVKDIVNE